jgi:hypothetical protein
VALESRVVWGLGVANTDDGACATWHNGSAGGGAAAAAAAAASSGSGEGSFTGPGSHREAALVTLVFFRPADAPPTPQPTAFFCPEDADADSSAPALGGSGGLTFAAFAALALVGALLLLGAGVVRAGRWEEDRLVADAE